MPDILRMLWMYFFTSEISDFNNRTILLNINVDEQVSVHRLHLIMKAQWNTLDYVLYMTVDSGNGGHFLSISPPLVNPEPLILLSKETESTLIWLKSLHRTPLGPFTITMSLQSDVNIFWDVDSSIAENSLHLLSRCSKIELEFQVVFKCHI